LDKGSRSRWFWVRLTISLPVQYILMWHRNGQFEETTSGTTNAFIQDGMLFIRPTLQDEHLVETNGSIIDLLKNGNCASTRWLDCVAATNLDNGTIVPPVRSARISTRFGTKIKYGRIEVTAKMPSGDWLWPAIWMLPVDSKYGDWPRSGEIDIAESRGNGYKYPLGGNNIVSSTLHWGPSQEHNRWWRNHVKRQALHSRYSDDFHVFGLEWSEKYLFTYIDTRLLQVLYTNFNEPLWKRGKFPPSSRNGIKPVDPWSSTQRFSTPFDQDFYLILSLGIGGTNGWFQDGTDGKPWVDSSPTAKLDFWRARNDWLPTWKANGSMIIKSVKVRHTTLSRDYNTDNQ
jgi:beta-glucanase (GH16 family)